MASFSDLLKKAWNVVFHDAKSFWLIFCLTGFFAISMVLLSFVADLLSGHGDAIKHMLAGNITLIVALCALAVIGAIVFVVALFYPSFLGMMGITHLYQKKKISLTSLFAENKRLLPYIGTGILSGVSLAGVVAALLLGFLLIVSIYLAFVSMSGYADTFTANLIGGIFAALFFIGFAIIVIFCSVAIIFSMPAFFLRDIRYASAIRESIAAIKGKWWQTFGYLFCMVIMLIAASWVIMGISLAIPILVPQLNSNIWLDLFFGLLGAGVQVIGQAFYFAFLLALYDEYKKNPTSTKTLNK